MQLWVFGDFTTPPFAFDKATCSLDAPCLSKNMFWCNGELVHLIESIELFLQRSDLWELQVPTVAKWLMALAGTKVKPITSHGHLRIDMMAKDEHN